MNSLWTPLRARFWVGRKAAIFLSSHFLFFPRVVGKEEGWLIPRR